MRHRLCRWIANSTACHVAQQQNAEHCWRAPPHLNCIALSAGGRGLCQRGGDDLAIHPLPAPHLWHRGPPRKYSRVAPLSCNKMQGAKAATTHGSKGPHCGCTDRVYSQPLASENATSGLAEMADLHTTACMASLGQHMGHLLVATSKMHQDAS